MTWVLVSLLGLVAGVVSGGAGGLVPNRPNAPMRVAPGNGGVILLKRGITPLVVRVPYAIQLMVCAMTMIAMVP